MGVSTEGSAGDDRARVVEGLTRHYAPAVLGICLAHTRSVHDAEDAVQDTLVKAITGIEQVREPSRTREWLLQIARRVCMDRYRRRRETQPLPEQLPAPDCTVDPRLEELHVALSRLPEDYREAISLYYLDGRSTVAVAQALGITEGAARQRLSRGRLMLHQSMTEDQQP
jgi:RNA polymerase sigma-70 factor, ECF subfamily